MKARLNQLIFGDMPEQEAQNFLLHLNQNLTAPILALCVETLKLHQTLFDVQLPKTVFDVCGTGGDKARVGACSFNISTAVAFVLAGCDVPVIKHANRAASSLAGSVDVLDALGVPSQLSPLQAQKCFDDVGLLFLNAAHYYPSLKNLARVRKNLGVPTIFNLAGPLANPAAITHQIIGCYAPDKAQIMAEALTLLGRKNFAVLQAADGLDEISPNAPTHIIEPEKQYDVRPEDFCVASSSLDFIAGGDAAHNARMIEDIFEGSKGPPRNVVVMNAAFALMQLGLKAQDAAAQVAQALDNGAALKILKGMRAHG